MNKVTEEVDFKNFAEENAVEFFDPFTPEEMPEEVIVYGSETE